MIVAEKVTSHPGLCKENHQCPMRGVGVTLPMAEAYHTKRIGESAGKSAQEVYPMAIALDTQPETGQAVDYPESDGQPMAENTRQFEWIVTIKENLDSLLPNAFVAGDLFWYPVEGQNAIRQAPDVLVAFGRPKGHRGSYRQWEEEHIAPQVVFEVLSPGNRVMEMLRKERFYARHGVQEYYVYDPDANELEGWHVLAGQWHPIEESNGWTSPLLGIRFALTAETLEIYRPDGSRFETFAELLQRAETALAENAALRAEVATLRRQLHAASGQPSGPETPTPC